MSEPFTIAASCASLIDAVVKIILEAGNLARKVRDSRHDMNGINAELLAIKTSVRILYDDFTTSELNLPAILLGALSGILDCCANTSKETYKMIAKLVDNTSQANGWHATKRTDATKSRQRLEVLRSVLDLALDHVSLFTVPYAEVEESSAAASKEQRGLEPDNIRAMELLKRIDLERKRIKSQTDYKAHVLDQRLNELKACAEAMAMGYGADEGEPRRSDSMAPEEESNIPRNKPHESTLTTSSEASGNGIGTWLANIASHTVRKPATPRSQHPRSRIRNGRPQPVPRGTNQRKQVIYAPPTVTDLDTPGLSHMNQRVDADKVAIAETKRLELTPDGRTALDWRLRSTDKSARPMEVERALWEGADPNAEDPEFGFLFIRAAHRLPLDVVRLLVEYGADITKTSTGPYSSALHAAVLGNKLDTVQYLVEFGLSIDAADSRGKTPLQFAVETPGAYPIAKYLLEAGADITGISLQSIVAASNIDSRERSMMVELLLAHGAEEVLKEDSCARRGKGLAVLGLT